MTKEEKLVVDNYCREYNIDFRTKGMIVHHYLDIGERQASCLSDKIIEEMYQEQLEEEKEAESRGSVLLITADFTKYLLKACMGLRLLAPIIRYKLIKEWL